MLVSFVVPSLSLNLSPSSSPQKKTQQKIFYDCVRQWSVRHRINFYKRTCASKTFTNPIITNDDQWSNNLPRNSYKIWVFCKVHEKNMNILKIYIYKHLKDVEQKFCRSFTHFVRVYVTMISYFIYFYVN